jgi:TolA-binding protein
MLKEERLMFILRLLVPLILCLPLFNVQAQAQSHSGKQVEQSRSQIEELRRQIEDIQSENQRKIEQLQRKIEQLEAERAVEKEKEEKVLAEEKDLWYKQFEAGYKKGFFLKSKDGNFSMRMRLRTQFQFSVNDTDEEDTATDFNIRRFRIKWDGHAFRPWFHYVAQISADNYGTRILMPPMKRRFFQELDSTRFLSVERS